MTTKLILLSLLFIAGLKTFAGNEATNATPVTTIAEDTADMMVLGRPTNSISCGIIFYSYKTLSSLTNKNKIILVQNNQMVSDADVVIVNNSTNTFRFWQFWPPTELACQIALTDEHGKAVPKTALGARYGRSPTASPDNQPTIHAGKLGLIGGFISPGYFSSWGGQEYNPIKNLPQCFKLEKPGNYKFTLINRIYVREHLGTNNNWQSYVLKPLTFPPVTVGVRVEKELNSTRQP